MQVALPGDAVTVYETGAPPVKGAEIVTVAEAFPATAVGAPGVPGAETEEVTVKAADLVPAPEILVTVTDLEPELKVFGMVNVIVLLSRTLKVAALPPTETLLTLTNASHLDVTVIWSPGATVVEL